MYRVLLTAPAQRDLDDVPRREFPKIKDNIISLGDNPRPRNVIKLEGSLHRIRVGNWRILYDIYDGRKEVHVLRVVRRSERTYKHI